MENQLAVFEDKQIRRVWDELREVWYFSVVDVIRALTDSLNPTEHRDKLSPGSNGNYRRKEA